jgi:hypothetical protein
VPNEKGLAFVGELEFRQPITEVDDCNIADVLFIAKFITSSPNNCCHVAAVEDYNVLPQ